MIDWFHQLPIAGMALCVFAATYLCAGVIHWTVTRLAVGEWALAFKSISPGMLPAMGIIFALLVAFLANEVWGELDRAKAAVTTEASALRSVVLLAASFPGEPETRLRDLVRQHISESVSKEWPAMARQNITLTLAPPALAEALHVTLALTPNSAGQTAAQREIVAALETALDARRQCIILSRSSVNRIKWTGLLAQAICTLIAIAMVHSDNQRSAALALWLFASGVAVSVVLIAAHERPFAGAIAVQPDLMLQVMPEPGAPLRSP